MHWTAPFAAYLGEFAANQSSRRDSMLDAKFCPESVAFKNESAEATDFTDGTDEGEFFYIIEISGAHLSFVGRGESKPEACQKLAGG